MSATLTTPPSDAALPRWRRLNRFQAALVHLGRGRLFRRFDRKITDEDDLFAFLLAGTIFTERIFDIQGIGLTALDAINTKDLPIISATVLISAAFIVTANIVVDIVYSVIDPRVRLS